VSTLNTVLKFGVWGLWVGERVGYRCWWTVLSFDFGIGYNRCNRVSLP
jgi:hypothetical protein